MFTLSPIDLSLRRNHLCTTYLWAGVKGIFQKLTAKATLKEAVQAINGQKTITITIPIRAIEFTPASMINIYNLRY